jgi:hypothetical protein
MTIIGPIIPPIVTPLGGGLPWEQGGGSAYDPGTEAGVVLDLWAESGVTQAGTGVSSWVDRKGLKDFVQGTDANRPTYEAAGLGGRPSVLFVDANGDKMRVASGPTSTSKSYSVIAALDPVTNGTDDWLLDVQTGRLTLSTGTSGTARIGFSDGSFKTFGAGADSTLPPQILRWKFTNGGSAEVFRGSSSLGTAAYTGRDLGGACGICGAYDGSAGSNPDVRIGRLILCDTLDDARDARILAHLSSYYGIAL